GPVEDQLAVEVVELVLGHPSRELLELEPYRPAALVAPLDRHADTPLDRHEHALEGEAALVVRLGLLASLDDRRVHERRGRLFLVALEDEDPPQDADLRRGDADTSRILHQVPHPRDERLEVVVEALDLARLHPQDRVGVLADLGKRETAPCLLLGVVLLLLVCPDLACFGHLDSLGWAHLEPWASASGRRSWARARRGRRRRATGPSGGCSRPTSRGAPSSAGRSGGGSGTSGPTRRRTSRRSAGRCRGWCGCGRSTAAGDGAAAGDRPRDRRARAFARGRVAGARRGVRRSA